MESQATMLNMKLAQLAKLHIAKQPILAYYRFAVTLPVITVNYMYSSLYGRTGLRR